MNTLPIWTVGHACNVATRPEGLLILCEERKERVVLPTAEVAAARVQLSPSLRHVAPLPRVPGRFRRFSVSRTARQSAPNLYLVAESVLRKSRHRSRKPVRTIPTSPLEKSTLNSKKVEAAGRSTFATNGWPGNRRKAIVAMFGILGKSGINAARFRR
jgi:hypothetical protein